MRILAITDLTGPIVDIRLETPLRHLKAQGLIQSFAVCNSKLEGPAPSDAEFDSILLQRLGAPALLAALGDGGVPFCLDLDDNLLLPASYRRGSIPEMGIDMAVECCRVLSCPTRILAQTLEKHTGLQLAQKVRLTPNALEFPGSVRSARRPEQLIWIQSDAAALDHSAARLRAAVEDFAARRDIAIQMIGDAMKTGKPPARSRHMPSMPHHELIAYLDAGPSSIGLAPLETVADEATLDFISSKSDVKKLLYGGMGHTGVYSLALPYMESDLTAGIMAPNTYGGWMAALEQCYESAWQRGPAEAERIREIRSAARVARLHWLPALQQAASPRPVSLAALRQRLASGGSVASPTPAKYEENAGMQTEENTSAGLASQQRLHALETRVRMLTQALRQTRQDIDAIYQSATWKTLVKLGGIAQRLLPSLGRGKKA